MQSQSVHTEARLEFRNVQGLLKFALRMTTYCCMPSIHGQCGLQFFMLLMSDWLNFQDRVAFEFVVMVYGCLSGHAPTALYHFPPRRRNFVDHSILHVPWHRLSAYGLWKFSVAIPTTWSILVLILSVILTSVEVFGVSTD